MNNRSNSHATPSIAALAFAVAGFSSAASAQQAMPTDPTTSPDPHMMKLDRNGDGVIDRDEADARLRKAFDQWDSNRDGRIDAAEYAAAGLPSKPPGGTAH